MFARSRASNLTKGPIDGDDASMTAKLAAMLAEIRRIRGADGRDFARFGSRLVVGRGRVAGGAGSSTGSDSR